MHVEEQLEEVERQKKLNWNVSAPFKLRLEILSWLKQESLSKEIASRIREAEQEVKERSDKIAKDIWFRAMQRIAGDYVAESTNPDSSPIRWYREGRIIGREGRNIRTFES